MGRAPGRKGGSAIRWVVVVVGVGVIDPPLPPYARQGPGGSEKNIGVGTPILMYEVVPPASSAFSPSFPVPRPAEPGHDERRDARLDAAAHHGVGGTDLGGVPVMNDCTSPIDPELVSLFLSQIYTATEDDRPRSGLRYAAWLLHCLVLPHRKKTIFYGNTYFFKGI